jgi:MSHA biogenesis protein MshE
MAPRQKIRLGDLLIQAELITQAQLDNALADQKKSGRKLGQILVDDGYVKEDQMLQTVSDQLKIPYVDLLHYKYNPEVVRLISEIQARRFRVIALVRDENGILVGMADPTNIFAYDELSRLLGQPVRMAVVRESELLQTIDSVYRRTDEISEFAGELSDELSQGDVDLGDMLATADVADAPVVKLLQSLFEDAVQIGSSDIHIEPGEDVLRIRQRVDGVLQEQVMNEVRIAPALVLRLKLIAGLNISEKRLPQDGRFSMKVKDRNIDVRISTMPVHHGESVVLRLLDQSGGVIDIDQLGMPVAVRERVKLLIKRPHGMFLVTGPTGSGKTTTLYAALTILNVPEKNIITVEDPVEYRLPRLNQVQVNTDIGLTFARVLRTTLRQDPDIVLIGEMRDEETTEIAARAAMTGHMVLSTLHTNDAISTISRLLDMGIKDYLLASTLHAILAQRLVRRICLSCITEMELDGQQAAWVQTHGMGSIEDVTFKKGIGCAHCNYTGYAGRIGVYELLEIDQQLAGALSHGDSVTFERMARSVPGYKSLESIALGYAVEGITTVAEVLRISADVAVLTDPASAGDDETGAV